MTLPATFFCEGMPLVTRLTQPSLWRWWQLGLEDSPVLSLSRISHLTSSFLLE